MSKIIIRKYAKADNRIKPWDKVYGNSKGYAVIDQSFMSMRHNGVYTKKRLTNVSYSEGKVKPL